MSFIDGDSRDQISLLPACADDYVAPAAFFRCVVEMGAYVIADFVRPTQNTRAAFGMPDRDGFAGDAGNSTSRWNDPTRITPKQQP